MMANHNPDGVNITNYFFFFFAALYTLTKTIDLAIDDGVHRISHGISSDVLCYM